MRTKAHLVLPPPLCRTCAGHWETAGEAAGEAVPDLRQALGDASEMVRVAAAQALERIGEAAQEAVPDLRRALEDAAEGVRVAAALALGEIGEAAQEAVPD